MARESYFVGLFGEKAADLWAHVIKKANELTREVRTVDEPKSS
jgi:hypothetical protein